MRLCRVELSSVSRLCVTTPTQATETMAVLFRKVQRRSTVENKIRKKPPSHYHWPPRMFTKPVFCLLCLWRQTWPNRKRPWTAYSSTGNGRGVNRLFYQVFLYWKKLHIRANSVGKWVLVGVTGTHGLVSKWIIKEGVADLTATNDDCWPKKTKT
jgi:hypothetical protein